MEEPYIAEKFLFDVLEKLPNLSNIYKVQEEQSDPYCLIQSEVACEYTLHYLLQNRKKRLILPEEINDFTNRVIIASSWQYTRNVYRFDSSVYQELIQQELDAFPEGILDDFPEPCIFIETQNNLGVREGFFAQIDKRGTAYSILFMFLSHDQSAFMTRLPVRPNENISYLIDEILDTFEPDVEQRYYAEQKFKQALNLILYFGCNNVDYSGRKKPSFKTNWKFKKATTYYTMGKSVGKMMQNSSIEGKQVPHIRRAHYHHYWIGKRDGERTRIRRFVYPVFVNCKAKKSKEKLNIKTQFIDIK